MTKHYDFPRGMLAVSWTLYALRLAALLVFAAWFVIGCVNQPAGRTVSRMAESAGSSQLALTKRANGYHTGEYHIGTAIYLAPDVHFEVLTEVGGKVRVYHWKATLGAGVSAGLALADALTRSMHDSATRSASEVGRLVLWAATDASEWANRVEIPVLAGAPQLVRTVQ